MRVYHRPGTGAAGSTKTQQQSWMSMLITEPPIKAMALARTKKDLRSAGGAYEGLLEPYVTGPGRSLRHFLTIYNANGLTLGDLYEIMVEESMYHKDIITADFHWHGTFRGASIRYR